MPLSLTVVPASTRAGEAAIKVLLSHESSPQIRGIYRDLAKVPSEFTKHPNFAAIQGDVGGDSPLNFETSDAVFYIPPTPYDGSDIEKFAHKTAEIVKTALKNSPSVRRLVLFSAMGSQYSKDVGNLRLNYISDEILKDSVPEVVIPRPGYFQENWAHAFETLQGEPPVFYSILSPEDHKIPMVNIEDLGDVCARKLLETGQSLPATPQFFNFYGPRHYSTNDVKAALEEVTGKQVAAVVIPKDELVPFLSQQVLPTMAEEMAEMTRAALPGGVMVGDFEDEPGTVKGQTELVDTLRKLYQA